MISRFLRGYPKLSIGGHQGIESKRSIQPARVRQNPNFGNPEDNVLPAPSHRPLVEDSCERRLPKKSKKAWMVTLYLPFQTLSGCAKLVES